MQRTSVSLPFTTLLPMPTATTLGTLPRNLADASCFALRCCSVISAFMVILLYDLSSSSKKAAARPYVDVERVEIEPNLVDEVELVVLPHAAEPGHPSGAVR